MMRADRLTRAAVPIGIAVLAGGLMLAPHSDAVTTPADTTTITVGAKPLAVAVSHKVGKAFVANEASVSVIDLATNQVTATIPSSANGEAQSAITLARGGTRAYVGASGSPYMSVINTVTGNVIDDSVVVGSGTSQMATAQGPDGQRLFLAQTQASRVAVIPTSDLSDVDYLGLPKEPADVAAVPGTKTVWVASIESSRIWVVRGEDPKVVRTIKVGQAGPLNALAISADGTRALAAGAAGISVLKVPSGKVLHTFAANDVFPTSNNLNIGDVALSPKASRGYVLNSGFPDAPPVRGTVRILDLRHERIGNAVRTGLSPYAMVLASGKKTGYVANWNSATVTAFPTVG